MQSVAVSCAADSAQSSNTTGWAYNAPAAGQSVPVSCNNGYSTPCVGVSRMLELTGRQGIYDTSDSVMIGGADRSNSLPSMLGSLGALTFGLVFGCHIDSRYTM